MDAEANILSEKGKKKVRVKRQNKAQNDMNTYCVTTDDYVNEGEFT